MRKLKLALASLFGLSLLAFPVGAVSAQSIFSEACKGDNQNSTVCKDQQPQSHSSNSLYGREGIITKIIGLLSIVVGIAAVIVIIIGGINYMLSTGDATKTNNAKNTILYALVGLVIAVFAQILVTFVIGRLR